MDAKSLLKPPARRMPPSRIGPRLLCEDQGCAQQGAEHGETDRASPCSGSGPRGSRGDHFVKTVVKGKVELGVRAAGVVTLLRGDQGAEFADRVGECLLALDPKLVR